MHTDDEKDRILSLTGGSLGAFGSLALVITFLCNKHMRTPSTFKVFIMSVCDFSLAIIMPGLTGGPCIFAAFCTNFFLVATFSWYFLIAFDLHRLLNGKGVPKRISYGAHLLAWIPSTIAAIAPLITDAYGKIEAEAWLICWYKELDTVQKLAIVIPLGIYMCFTVFLLIEYRYKGHLILASSPKVHRRVTYHLLLFCLVYLGTWSWFLISTFQDIFSFKQRHAWLDDLAFFQFKSSGFWNFMVWIYSPVFLHARKKQKEQKQKQEKESATSDSDSYSYSGTDTSAGTTAQEMTAQRPAVPRDFTVSTSPDVESQSEEPEIPMPSRNTTAFIPPPSSSPPRTSPSPTSISSHASINALSGGSREIFGGKTGRSNSGSLT